MLRPRSVAGRWLASLSALGPQRYPPPAPIARFSTSPGLVRIETDSKEGLDKAEDKVEEVESTPRDQDESGQRSLPELEGSSSSNEPEEGKPLSFPTHLVGSTPHLPASKFGLKTSTKPGSLSTPPVSKPQKGAVPKKQVRSQPTKRKLDKTAALDLAEDSASKSEDKQGDETAPSKPKPRTALFKRVKVVAQSKAVEPAPTKKAVAALSLAITPAETASSLSGKEGEPSEESSSDFGILPTTKFPLPKPKRVASSLVKTAFMDRAAGSKPHRLNAPALSSNHRVNTSIAILRDEFVRQGAPPSAMMHLNLCLQAVFPRQLPPDRPLAAVDIDPMVKTWLFQDLMPERTPERTKKAYVFVDDPYLVTSRSQHQPHQDALYAPSRKSEVAIILRSLADVFSTDEEPLMRVYADPQLVGESDHRAHADVGLRLVRLPSTRTDKEFFSDQMVLTDMWMAAAENRDEAATLIILTTKPGYSAALSKIANKGHQVVVLAPENLRPLPLGLVSTYFYGAQAVLETRTKESFTKDPALKAPSTDVSADKGVRPTTAEDASSRMSKLLSSIASNKLFVDRHNGLLAKAKLTLAEGPLLDENANQEGRRKSKLKTQIRVWERSLSIAKRRATVLQIKLVELQGSEGTRETEEGITQEVDPNNQTSSSSASVQLHLPSSKPHEAPINELAAAATSTEPAPTPTLDPVEVPSVKLVHSATGHAEDPEDSPAVQALFAREETLRMAVRHASFSFYKQSARARILRDKIDASRPSAENEDEQQLDVAEEERLLTKIKAEVEGLRAALQNSEEQYFALCSTLGVGRLQSMVDGGIARMDTLRDDWRPFVDEQGRPLPLLSESDAIKLKELRYQHGVCGHAIGRWRKAVDVIQTRQPQDQENSEVQALRVQEENLRQAIYDTLPSIGARSVAVRDAQRAIDEPGPSSLKESPSNMDGRLLRLKMAKDELDEAKRTLERTEKDYAVVCSSLGLVRLKSLINAYEVEKKALNRNLSGLLKHQKGGKVDNLSKEAKKKVKELRTRLISQAFAFKRRSRAIVEIEGRKVEDGASIGEEKVVDSTDSEDRVGSQPVEGADDVLAEESQSTEPKPSSSD